MALALALGMVAGYFVREHSLPLPPSTAPRFVARALRHAPAEPVASVPPSAAPPRYAEPPSTAERRRVAPPASDLRSADAAPPSAPAPEVEPLPFAAIPTAPSGDDARGDGRPRVAIVIDDLGDSLEGARAVLALEPPVTVAVIPFRPYSARIAGAAVERGREVILHLPLEPQDANEMGRAPGFLRVGMSSDGLERQLEADLAAVPYIVGVNGHMGSRFTRDPIAMERLLAALRARGLFYLDSLTTPASVAATTAARLRVPFAQRTVFLDHDTRPDAIARSLAQLEALARSHREVIAIGHPHATTLAALAPWLRRMSTAGVQFVPASALVR